MKKLLPAIAVCMILVTGCKKDVTPANDQTQQEVRGLAKKPTISAAEIKARFEAGLYITRRLEGKTPQEFSTYLKQHPEYRYLIRRALDIVPTTCDANTKISQWLDQQLADWNQEVITYAALTGMLDFPTFDALLFENSSVNQYFGVNGAYTQTLEKTFKDLKRFWNIQSNNIVLVAMHGSMLRDRERVIRIDMIVYNDSRAQAEQWADLILFLLDAFPQYRNGEHPIFTFNAFAQSSFNFPPYGVIPAKIVMGDGALEGYSAIGYGDVAPQAILAHEFGHQIQFQLNVFTGFSTPEASRRLELMADAFAGYYLSHARGAAMQWKRVQQFLQVFYNTGDCLFTNIMHHGTPAQRMAAAEWGYQVANDAQKQGHILTAQQFYALFEAKLPQLITP